MSQDTGAYQPTTGSSIGTENAIDFNGTSDWLKADSGLGVDIKSLFVVLKPDAAIDQTTPGLYITSTVADFKTVGLVFGSETAALTNEVIALLDENQANVYVDRQGISNANYASISAAGHIFSNVLATDWFMGVDGSADLRNLTSGTRHDLLYTSTFGVGAGLRRWFAEKWFNGKIGEIICIQTAVDSATRYKIEGYLAWKWGLVANLPAGHPYKSAPPYA